MTDMADSGFPALMIDNHGPGIFPEPVLCGIYSPGMVFLQILIIF